MPTRPRLAPSRPRRHARPLAARRRSGERRPRDLGRRRRRLERGQPGADLRDHDRRAEPEDLLVGGRCGLRGRSLASAGAALGNRRWPVPAGGERSGSGAGDTERAFRVDLTPPRITFRQPTSGMQIEQNALLLADYSCQDAVACTGTVPPGAALDTSQAGPATFSVRALDDAGNEAVSLVDYLVRATVPSAEPVQPPAGGPGSPPPSNPITLTLINAPDLRPAAGDMIWTRRPLLRWKARPGARLYNVQVFRLLGDASIKKVVSAFPRVNRFRVPARRIAWGNRYIWRVWPQLPRGLFVLPARHQLLLRPSPLTAAPPLDPPAQRRDQRGPRTLRSRLLHRYPGLRALVAQRIEHRFPKPGVAGSTPAGGMRERSTRCGGSVRGHPRGPPWAAR